jgi:hypothetical protein
MYIETHIFLIKRTVDKKKDNAIFFLESESCFKLSRVVVGGEAAGDAAAD